MRLKTWSFITLVATGIFAGCGVPDDLDRTDPELSGKFDEIDPVDDELLGYIQVNAPKDALIVNATLDYRNYYLKLGEKTRVLAGDGCLSVTSRIDVNSEDVRFEQCGIKVTKNKTTTVMLTTLGLEYSTTKLDLGPYPVMSVYHDDGTEKKLIHAVRPDVRGYGSNPSAIVFQSSTAADFNYGIYGYSGAWNGNDPEDYAISPTGNYQVEWSRAAMVNESKAFTLTKASRNIVDVTPKDLRATVRLLPPKKRVQPEIFKTDCEGHTGDPHYFFQARDINETIYPIWEPGPYIVSHDWAPNVANTQNGIIETKGFNLNEPIEFKVLPPVGNEVGTFVYLGDHPFRYELVVNNQLMVLDLKPGEVREIQMKRIDVNDVKVTLETGVTEMVKGKYQVYRETASGDWEQLQLARSSERDCTTQYQGSYLKVFPTKTGLDVFPGKYKVVVDYATKEGAKSQEFILNMQ